MEIRKLKYLFLEKCKMETVKKAYGLSAEVEVMFERRMRYKSLFEKDFFPSQYVIFSSEWNEPKHFMFIILILYFVQCTFFWIISFEVKTKYFVFFVFAI